MEVPFFTTTAANLAIRLANLPLLIRVHTILLTSICRAMPLSARTIKKKTILFNVNIVVKNNWKCGLAWSVLLSRTSTCHYSFPKHFSYCFCMLSEFAKVFERKVWCVQVAHLHSAASALSSLSWCFQLSTNLDKDFFWYLWYCGKKQIKCGLA